ncbi:MAG: hypothetical protein ACP5HU_02915 [Phycisphaerae bacterium]
MTNKTRQFLKGMGSALDIGAVSSGCVTRVGAGLDLGRTEAQALGSDWQKVSQDFGCAFRKIIRGGEYVQPK